MCGAPGKWTTWYVSVAARYGWLDSTLRTHFSAGRLEGSQFRSCRLPRRRDTPATWDSTRSRAAGSALSRSHVMMCRRCSWTASNTSARGMRASVPSVLYACWSSLRWRCAMYASSE